MRKISTNIASSHKKRSIISCLFSFITLCSLIISSCSLEDICQNGEKMCEVCANDDCSEGTGEIYRSSNYQKNWNATTGNNQRCRVYSCFDQHFNLVEPTDGRPYEICENGFDTHDGVCFPECTLNDLRCVGENPKSGKCTIQNCIAHNNRNTWKDTEVTCSKGFDFNTQTCIPECTLGKVQCVSGSESDECTIQKCVEEEETLIKWIDTEYTCNQGFDNSKQICAESCELGEERQESCEESESYPLCISQKFCTKTPHPYKIEWITSFTCLFGFDDSKSGYPTCKDPCDIGVKLNENDIISVIDSDNFEQFYSCNETGYHETTCGNVDFHEIDE